ncbi:MAG: GNAT family N-acetyltransferase [Patescibacteria group bacterium]
MDLPDHSTYRILHINDLSSISPELIDSWDRCITQGSHGSFFQSPVWVRTWWNYFGMNHTLYLLFALDKHEAVRAVFPGMISQRKFLRKKLRVLSFIGTPLNDRGSVPYDTPHLRTLDAIITYLAQHRNEWDLIRLEELPSDSEFLKKLMTHTAFIPHVIIPASSHLHILRSEIDAPKEKIALEAKEDLKRKRKKLENLGAVRYTLVHNEKDSHWLLDLFFSLQKQRSSDVAFSSVFRNPKLKKFFHALIDTSRDSQTLQFSTLQTRDKIAAIQCHFVKNKDNALYLTTFDPAYHPFSPSLLLTQKILGSFYDSNLSSYDFGRGTELYKRRFCSSLQQYNNFIAAPEHPLLMHINQWYYQIQLHAKSIPHIASSLRVIKKYLISIRMVFTPHAITTFFKAVARRVIFSALYFSGLAWLYTQRTSHRARILCYHRVPVQPTDALLDVSITAFNKQMAYLSSHFSVQKFEIVAEWIAEKKLFPPHTAAITFDDGTKDWVHYVLPALASFRIPAMFFIATGFIDNVSVRYAQWHTSAPALTRDDLITLHQSPFATLGAHTVHHARLSSLHADEITKEITNSRTQLENITGSPIRYFAYPFGKSSDYNDETKKMLARCGYSAACTIEERTASLHDDPYEIPRLVIFDEPLWMFKVRVSGIFDDLRIAIRCIFRL